MMNAQWIALQELSFNLLEASEELRQGLASAAKIMQKCPACNTGEGLKTARKVWKALDAYEPAASALAKLLEALNTEVLGDRLQ